MHPLLNIAVRAARRAGSIINRASLDGGGILRWPRREGGAEPATPASASLARWRLRSAARSRLKCGAGHGESERERNDEHTTVRRQSASSFGVSSGSGRES